MQGQAVHFFRTSVLAQMDAERCRIDMHAGYTPEPIPYGLNRYQNEARRLYRVLDTQLGKSKSGFIVGDRMTVADIACLGTCSFRGKLTYSKRHWSMSG